jgi:hypothetical protein
MGHPLLTFCLRLLLLTVSNPFLPVAVQALFRFTLADWKMSRKVYQLLRDHFCKLTRVSCESCFVLSFIARPNVQVSDASKRDIEAASDEGGMEAGMLPLNR